MAHGESAHLAADLVAAARGLAAIGSDENLAAISECPLLPSAGTFSAVQHDPELLVSALRKQVADEAGQAGIPDRGQSDVCLPVALENELIGPADSAVLAAAERSVVEMASVKAPPFRIVTHSTRALRPLRYALMALPVPPRVVASWELPPDAEMPPILGN